MSNAADLSFALYAAQVQREADLKVIADLRESLARAFLALDEAAELAEKWHRLAVGMSDPLA